MKTLVALLSIALSAAAQQVTYESDGALASGSYSQSINVPKFHLHNRTLTHAHLVIGSLTYAHGEGLTGELTVHAVVTGLGQTLVDYSYVVNTDFQNWNVTAGISANFDTDFNLALADVEGPGDITVCAHVDVTDQFGVPETGQTILIVTYDFEKNNGKH